MNIMGIKTRISQSNLPDSRYIFTKCQIHQGFFDALVEKTLQVWWTIIIWKGLLFSCDIDIVFEGFLLYPMCMMLFPCCKLFICLLLQLSVMITLWHSRSIKEALYQSVVIFQLHLILHSGTLFPFSLSKFSLFLPSLELRWIPPDNLALQFV